MPTKTCPSCGGSGNKAVSGVQTGTANGCPTCNGSGTVYESSPSGNTGGCFTGDTRVKTLKGWKEIRSINKNDPVYSIGANGQVYLSNVICKKIYTSRDILKVETDIDSFDVTDAHSLLVNSNVWKRVGDLDVGDVIVHVNETGNLTESTVKSIKFQGNENVYNLIVEGSYNFIVQGCIAHSFTYFRNLRICFYNVVRWIRDKPKHAIRPKSIRTS